MTAHDALALLVELGAPPRLVRHHELVLEAARQITAGLADFAFDAQLVHLGAALHDAGKIAHSDEMSAPGHRHEPAGRALLIERGVAPEIARFCVTHASWDDPDGALEDLLVALADKLWKGKRVDDLEARALDRLAAQSARPRWEIFDRFDALCESIAAEGDDRLARSLTP